MLQRARQRTFNAIGSADATTRQTVGDAWQARLKATGSKTAAGTWKTDAGRKHTREPSGTCSSSVVVSTAVLTTDEANSDKLTSVIRLCKRRTCPQEQPRPDRRTHSTGGNPCNTLSVRATDDEVQKLSRSVE